MQGTFKGKLLLTFHFQLPWNIFFCHAVVWFTSADSFAVFHSATAVKSLVPLCTIIFWEQVVQGHFLSSPSLGPSVGPVIWNQPITFPHPQAITAHRGICTSPVLYSDITSLVFCSQPSHWPQPAKINRRIDRREWTRAGYNVQRLWTYLACTRPWVQFPKPFSPLQMHKIQQLFNHHRAPMQNTMELPLSLFHPHDPKFPSGRWEIFKWTFTKKWTGASPSGHSHVLQVPRKSIWDFFYQTHWNILSTILLYSLTTVEVSVPRNVECLTTLFLACIVIPFSLLETGS